MSWFYIALAAPALWGIANYIDKYLVQKYFEGSGVGALTIFSSIIGLVMVIGIPLFQPGVFSLSFGASAIAILSGMIVIAGYIAYFYAMQSNDTSTVVPIFQTIPFFGYIIAFFLLGEVLNINQIFGGLVIILGAVIISIDLNNKSQIKWGFLFLMLASSVASALSSAMFKLVAIEGGFWITMFWNYVGWVLMAAVLMVLVKSYRDEFLKLIKTAGPSILGLNAVNEIVNVAAVTLFSFATLLAPLALVQVVNGFQPAIVFGYGVILTLFFPQIIKEDISKKIVVQKIFAILVVIIGAFILQM